MNEDNVGSLERLGIETETEIESEILTPASVKSVRFRTAKPHGYSFREVDELMEMVISSIASYAKKLNQRDVDVHTLGRELDIERTNFLNAQAELQKLQLASNFAAGQAKVEQDKEGEAILARISSLQEELGVAHARIAELEYALSSTESSDDASVVNSLQAELANRDAHIQELNVHIQQLSAHQEQQATGGAEITSEREQQLLTHIEQITNQYGELVNMYTAATEENAALKESAPADSSSELAAAQARISALEEALAEYEKEEPEVVVLPDPNRQPSAPAPTRAYRNLPPGVRPEDLEGSDLPTWNATRN